MRRRLFHAWCLVCLLLTAGRLLAGYVLDMGVNVGRGSTARGEARQVSLLAGRGRLRFFCVHARPNFPIAPAQDGFFCDGRIEVTKLRQMRFDVTGFDSHWLERPGNPSGTSLYLISCPLWFAMIFALASPAGWLITVDDAVGKWIGEGASAFAVVQAAASTESASG